MTKTTPIKGWSEKILPEWTAYNRHMNVGYYTLIFDHGVAVFFEKIGLGRNYRETTSGSTFAVEHHITYNKEVVEGDTVECVSRLVGFDEKRLHHYHEMYHQKQGFLAATCEFLSLHVSLTTRRVSPMPIEKLNYLSKVLASHKNLPPVKYIGRVIKTPSISE